MPTLRRGDQASVLRCAASELLVVRSYADRLGIAGPTAWQKMANDTRSIRGICWTAARMHRRAPTTVTAALLARCDAATREIPRLAHTLFRLQRFGVPAPRLLAVGHSGDKVHLLAESPKVVPFVEAFAKATCALNGVSLEQAPWATSCAAFTTQATLCRQETPGSAGSASSSRATT